MVTVVSKVWHNVKIFQPYTDIPTPVHCQNWQAKQSGRQTSQFKNEQTRGKSVAESENNKMQ